MFLSSDPHYILQNPSHSSINSMIVYIFGSVKYLNLKMQQRSHRQTLSNCLKVMNLKELRFSLFLDSLL
jgi:hypothetical protein